MFELSLRASIAKTTTVRTRTLAKTRRTANEGITRASAVRRMQETSSKNCRLCTRSSDPSIALTARGGLARATYKPVANADDSLNAVAAFVEFLSQPANVNVKRARVAIVTVTPDAIQQLLSRDYSIGASRQNGEQRELLVR